MERIIVSQCVPIEEVLATAIKQMKERIITEVFFYYAGSRYRIEKE